jgi:hypothetical protein
MTWTETDESDVACLHVKRNGVVGCSYLNIKDVKKQLLQFNEVTQIHITEHIPLKSLDAKLVILRYTQSL